MKKVGVTFHDLPDDSIVKEIEKVLKEGMPEIKISQSGKDINIESKKDFPKREIKRLIRKYLAKSGFGKSTRVIANGPANYTIYYHEEQT
ncbi:MAG: 60S ribosomal protein L22 [Candidatus Odinarchaeota archaeon]